MEGERERVGKRKSRENERDRVERMKGIELRE